MSQGPTREFWEERYLTRQTGWDRGQAGPQLATWLAAGEFKAGSRVAVPGCGRGWEVVALARHGVETIGIDYSPQAVAQVRDLLGQEALQAQIIEADVTHWRPTHAVDAIYEQTCLCALHPDLWVAYASNLATWLSPGGRLYALFLQRPTAEAAQGFVVGPPYHCDIHALRALFPARDWNWPKPPYLQVPHPAGFSELGLILERR